MGANELQFDLPAVKYFELDGFEQQNDHMKNSKERKIT